MALVSEEAVRLWGKLRVEGGRTLFHPLVDHCLDVAVVCRSLLGTARARWMELTSGQCDRLAVVALLHDLGKCNWGFQAKARPEACDTAGHVLEAMATLCSSSLQAVWPDEWRALVSDICGWFERADEEALPMMLAAISHHGRPVSQQDFSAGGGHRLVRFWQARGGCDPMQGLAALARVARSSFPGAFAADVPAMSAPAPVQQHFAGLVMLADWIGSDTQFFPYRAGPDEDRLALAQEAARRALAAIGLEGPAERRHGPFPAVFGFSPSPLQALLTSQLPVDTTTRLLLAESDTGSGKTEAALAWFLRLYAAGEVDGLYFALPTRVAARELYGRVCQAVERAFQPELRPRPVLLAVPGYVRVDGQPVLTDPEGTLWDDDEQSRQRERLWAAERPKRFLAAPVAVGTIDQALLSVLKVKHSLLRSVCLDRHLLVVDEVHASDTYMGELLRVLLQGHLVRGGRALLLSATLGERSAAAFFGRTPRSLAQAVQRPYPSVTTAAAEVAVQAGRRSRGVSIELTASLEDAPLLVSLTEALQRGARVLVVCNTVRRANALLRAAESAWSASEPALLGALFSCEGVRCPHHGRFSRADRERLDAEVSRRLGKHSEAGPLLLIGTQTLEQSLDIDADWLVTDFAPMDVLLQRIGRLHRHERWHRPAGFERPRVLVRAPDRPLHEYLRPSGELRGPAGLGPVYADGRVLACTWHSLAAQPVLVIPEENRLRIESTTHPEAWAALGPQWKAHERYMEGDFLADLRQADRSILPRETPFGELHYSTDEGRVASRLGDPNYEMPLKVPCRSPFDAPIEHIAIPARWLQGQAPPEVLDVTPIEGGLRFVIGDRAFRYTRFGLEKDDARPAQ
jgi:CRISPR-associated endonuclease/helicase Cas3